LVLPSVKQKFAIVWTSNLKINIKILVGFGIVNQFSFWKVGLHKISQPLMMMMIIIIVIVIIIIAIICLQ
jgi:hypothetical protein